MKVTKKGILRFSGSILVIAITLILAFAISMPNGIVSNVKADWGLSSYPGFEITDIMVYSDTNFRMAWFTEADRQTNVSLNQVMEQIYVYMNVPDYVKADLPVDIDSNDYSTWIQVNGNITLPDSSIVSISLNYSGISGILTSDWGNYRQVIFVGENIGFTFDQNGWYILNISVYMMHKL